MHILTAAVLTLKSLWHRKFTTLLTVTSICLSISLLLGVERIRKAARTSFESTLSGTDLIVGARSGPVQLLLYSVFRIGTPTNNITWPTYQDLKAHPEVDWTIPISLGDSHRGYRVVGTDQNYFKHLRYGDNRALTFSEGRAFIDTNVIEVVLGSQVAKRLGYDLGQKIILSHGISEVSFQDHDNLPFRVVGILQPTGTPVDRALHISLEGMTALHIDWQQGAPPMPGEPQTTLADAQRLEAEGKLVPRDISAFLVGLSSKLGIFQVRRAFQEYDEEPISAILPGTTFQELWQSLSVAENALRVISYLVVLSGLLGMLAAILISLNERRREVAILRSLGGRPSMICLLFVFEALGLALIGATFGVVILLSMLYAGQLQIERNLGLFVPVQALSLSEWGWIALISGAATIMGLIPAWQAYRNSLSDGLTVRL